MDRFYIKKGAKDEDIKFLKEIGGLDYGDREICLKSNLLTKIDELSRNSHYSYFRRYN